MMMMTSASPVRGRRGFDAGRAQRATGSSTTIAKFCSTYVGPYVVLSLRHFRRASRCSLSLGRWWLRIRRGAVTAARCLLDLLGPAQRVLAADGEVAGGADALVIFRFGATLELGRSARTTMRPLWRYGVDAANTPDRKPR